MKLRLRERGLTRRNWWIIEGFTVQQRSIARIDWGASEKGVIVLLDRIFSDSAEVLAL